MTAEEFVEAEASMSRSPGSCNTMGTASTMASMAEALGMTLSGNAAIPAVDSRRRVMAQLTGRRIVQMVKDDLKPSDILTREAFQNAIRTNAAIGGSTNAVIHLLAIAGAWHSADAERLGRMGAQCPHHREPHALGQVSDGRVLLCGRPACRDQAAGRGRMLNKDALTVSGGAIWDEVKGARIDNDDVILPAERR